MRKKKERISEKIERRKLRDYFQKMFNGSDEKKIDNWERIIREEGEEELGDEEIEEQMKKLKKGKAGGSDGLSNEVWFYSSGETRRKFRDEKSLQRGRIPRGMERGPDNTDL